MFNTETKFGECKICKEKNILQSVIASYKNSVWCGWICNKCYKELVNKKD